MSSIRVGHFAHIPGEFRFRPVMQAVDDLTGGYTDIEDLTMRPPKVAMIPVDKFCGDLI